MQPFTVVTGVAAPMLMTNINTDLIAPSLMPGRTPEEASRLALKDKLFANLRYHADGTEKPDFPLAQPRYREARILLAGPNFGCGSSRETAVWSLMEAGIRCVIAPSFGDIFHDNALQNGLLPLRLDQPAIEQIAGALARSNRSEMTIDLQRCVVEVAGLAPISFSMAADRRMALLEGLDQLSLIMRSMPEIEAFERQAAQAQPWLWA